MLKKLPSDKINSTKNAFFFLSRAATLNSNCSFTFNLRFLYELKHKVCLSKTVCEIFHFRFRFVFFVFFSTKCMDSLTSKRHNSFQN